MKSSNLAAFLYRCKGAPLAIVCAMIGLERPTGLSELVVYTGYTDATVRSGLGRLAAMGLAQRTARDQRWILTPDAYRHWPIPRLNTIQGECHATSPWE